MTKIIRQLLILSASACLTGLLFSCNPERKLAKAFVENNRSRSVVVLFPDFIFKTNQKTFILDSLNITDKTQSDSVLLANSLYLKDINDSLFLANFSLGFEKELSAFGFTVFEENGMVEFMEKDTNAFVVNVAQLELEESIYTHRDEELIYDAHYYHDQDLNAVYVNAWIEITRVDETTAEPNVYFATGVVTDDMEGQFTYDIFSGNINYVYNIDSLKIKDLYEGAYTLGRTYASYTYDFLLNHYLDKALPAGDRSATYWRYDPYEQSFFPAYDDRLVPLDE